MKKSSPGQIYLADSRGITETGHFTRWCTFNYGEYTEDSRKPFGTLLSLNDELFMPGHRANYAGAQDIWVAIMPITGEVALKTDAADDELIDVGQVRVQYQPKGKSISLANTYREDRINFLYMEFMAGGKEATGFEPLIFPFEFGVQTSLMEIVNGQSAQKLPFTLHIGLFTGREDILYHMQDKNTLFFAFVIAGAFETQGRLMHQRDGLALWDLQEADMEALSNNAVILVMEIKKQAF